MAASIAPVGKPFVIGNKKAAVVDITGDSSYPTGGYALTAQGLGFPQKATVDAVIGLGTNVSTAFFDTQWNPATSKLQFTSGAAETTAATNLSTATMRCVAIAH